MQVTSTTWRLRMQVNPRVGRNHPKILANSRGMLLYPRHFSTCARIWGWLAAQYAWCVRKLGSQNHVVLPCALFAAPTQKSRKTHIIACSLIIGWHLLLFAALYKLAGSDWCHWLSFTWLHCFQMMFLRFARQSRVLRFIDALAHRFTSPYN